jgi:hypothetical protein
MSATITGQEQHSLYDTEWRSRAASVVTAKGGIGARNGPPKIEGYQRLVVNANNATESSRHFFAGHLAADKTLSVKKQSATEPRHRSAPPPGAAERNVREEMTPYPMQLLAAIFA